MPEAGHFVGTPMRKKVGPQGAVGITRSRQHTPGMENRAGRPTRCTGTRSAWLS